MRHLLLAAAAILSMAVSVHAQRAAAPTLDELQAVKDLLPLTPEEVVDLKLTAEDKDDTVKLSLFNYPASLTKKEKEKLQKKGLVVLRIVGEVEIKDNKETNPKKQVKAHRSGSVEIFVIDPGQGKVVAKKKEGLAKLCPG